MAVVFQNSGADSMQYQGALGDSSRLVHVAPAGTGEQWVTPAYSSVVNEAAVQSGMSGGIPLSVSPVKARHRHHHHHHPVKKGGFGEWVASALGQLGGGPSSPRASPRGASSRKDFALRDRLGRTVEIDSDDEGDWDRGAATAKVWGTRAGPSRVRPVDDLLINFQDLFPCLAPLFESCGCVRRRPRRALRAAPTTPGARIEHVCLDCGNVLDAQNVPGTVAIDMFDRGTAARHEAYLQVQAAQQPQETFQGYESWTLQPRNTNANAPGAIPLPQFDPAPARILRNRPGDVSHPPPPDLPTDDSGLVQLPQFDEPPNRNAQ
ncbi:hypothetical protein GNI_165570 [Gregarina niphandrodes]|uniref:Uncharacterized protein n=1 Tax=Gregarina niphandrodes TaxID=110365 RepID=A0A023AY52_GRENI|nr:hypothetical protein GNI_165570 [Gregarina niphandrodes]EZG43582.1 hypothetical protein GNI_165570 [Gregarina niphandrodes]|eukprot:XP_011133190.1 hypothetical protein GNI_165570 [Gregarina niphandrodes]